MTLFIAYSENMHQLIPDDGYSDVTLINATTCHVTVLFIYMLSYFQHLSKWKSK